MSLVVLGLSGGVDSAAAAKLLLAAGHRVYGLWLDTGAGGREDAQAVARTLGIPFEARDVGPELEACVKAPFAAAYLRGQTPSPCVLCNPRVKFPALLRAADALGAEYIATGHYARVQQDPGSGRFQLLRAAGGNDQSYMLCGLGQAVLSRLLLPLGALSGKGETRRLAAEAGLPVAEKADSMEICFIPDGDYAAFIEARGTLPPPGDFVDPAGRVLGRHRGIHHYTLGQRRGLRFSAGRRVFVSAIDPEKNTVTLDEDASLFVSTCRVEAVNWVSIPPPAGEFACTVRVRHSRNESPALVIPQENGALLRFTEPVRAPTPGQFAVFYDKALLLGGGQIV